jgi:hypothetical protein
MSGESPTHRPGNLRPAASPPHNVGSKYRTAIPAASEVAPSDQTGAPAAMSCRPITVSWRLTAHQGAKPLTGFSARTTLTAGPIPSDMRRSQLNIEKTQNDIGQVSRDIGRIQSYIGRIQSETAAIQSETAPVSRETCPISRETCPNKVLCVQYPGKLVQYPGKLVQYPGKRARTKLYSINNTLYSGRVSPYLSSRNRENPAFTWFRLH